MGRTVRFYRTQDGKSPVEEFLDSLPAKNAQKVVWVLRLVEELETVPSLYFKKLRDTDALWECRIQHGTNAYRIFCFFGPDGSLVLVNGFAKKSQKTPGTEIDLAQKHRRDFLGRRNI